MTVSIRSLLAGAVLVLACGVALAQPVRGTIEKAEGNHLTLRSAEGAPLQLTLADNALIVAVVKASMAEIKEGTYLGSAAMPQADGSQKALEIHIFPDPMRGVGEGHRPYAPVPSGTMTNGSTSGPIVTGVDGSTIVLRYKDGEKRIVVPKDTPIVRYEIGGHSDLKPGARVTILTPVRTTEGAIEASRINVGRDGVVPQ